MLSQFSASDSDVDRLHIYCYNCPLAGLDDSEWLELLRPFTAVQALHVSEILGGRLAFALEKVTTEMVVFPALDLLCLEGQPSFAVGIFVPVRRLSGRPVTILGTLREFESYPEE